MSAPPQPATRVLALAGALAVGGVAAETVRSPPALACALAALALTACARSRRGLVPVLVAALALGWALAGLRLASVHGAALARGAARGADALLEGEVLGDPVLAGGASRFLLGVRRAEIDGVPFALRERAWVGVSPPPRPPLRGGLIVRVDARLRPILFADLDASARAAARRLVRRGAAARAFASDVVVIGRASGPLARVAEAGRAAVRRAAARLPERRRGLLLGVTIGDTTLLDPQDDFDFRTTGLSHLLAVSGANVAMALALVALVLRAVRARRHVTVAALAATVLAFMAVTRFEPSVLRAGAMAAIALGGLVAGARRASIVALGVATLGLLAYDPFLARSVGFQLSVLATLGILMVAPRIVALLPRGPVGSAAAVTLGAQLAVAPLLVLHFRQVSLVSIAANLVVAPAVAPATLLGLLAAVLGALWSPLAGLAVLAGPPIAWMQWVAHALAELPLASVGTPGGALGFLIAAAMTAGALALARGARPRRAAPVLLSLALVATGGVWVRALGSPPPRGLAITMIDVGQGDAIVVRAGGRTMLVDGGPGPAPLLRGLRRAGVRRIDLLVLTHPHDDHVNGLAGLARRFPISRALDPFIADDLPAYRAFADALARRRIPRDRARRGMRYRLGPAEVDVLWPPVEHLEGTDGDVNNNSVVLRVRYGADTVLLAGEVQEEAMQILLEHHGLLRAGVVKVSHHGSRFMLPAFYGATRARVALIPVGPNRYGHPAPETLAALAGMRILRTDRSGTVSVALDGRGGLEVREERDGTDTGYPTGAAVA